MEERDGEKLVMFLNINALFAHRFVCFFLKANPVYNTDRAEERERISARGRVITLIIPGKKREK